jgi:hypothetical protein
MSGAGHSTYASFIKPNELDPFGLGSAMVITSSVLQISMSNANH